MAQVNHNYSYIFEVDGFTVWERLRNIRSFLTDRRQALNKAELIESKSEKQVELTNRKLKLIELELDEVRMNMSEVGEISNILRKEIELEEEYLEIKFSHDEAVILNSSHKELTQDCRDEINFLLKFEAKLAEEAEKTRIPGKLDREMYEINFPHEARIRLENRATAEIASSGTLSTDTIHYLRKDKAVLDSLSNTKIPIMIEHEDGRVQMVEHKLLSDATVEILKLDKSMDSNIAITNLVGYSDVKSLPHLKEENDGTNNNILE